MQSLLQLVAIGGDVRCCARGDLCFWVHRTLWAVRTCAVAFRCLCVCGRGGMVGCLAKHRWGYAYVQWRASNDRVLVGGRFSS